MKTSRSPSQVQYGLLPGQTVDIEGGVWKAELWNTITPSGDVDEDALRRELVRVATPWREGDGGDGGFVEKLYANHKITIGSLDRDKGVTVSAFPTTWRCSGRAGCGRLHSSPTVQCRCGRNGPHGQLPFILYHDACGKIEDPFYRKCPEHKQVAMFLPGTTKLDDTYLFCPVCNNKLGSASYLRKKCQCGRQGRRGEEMSFTVHRSASVFTPQTIALVNPPDKRERRRLNEAGGRAAALRWCLGGLEAAWVDGMEGGRADALRAQLRAAGVPENRVDETVAASGLEDSDDEPDLTPNVADLAGDEAEAIALSMAKGRATLETVEVSRGASGADYVERCRTEAERAGVQRVDLCDRFPVFKGVYGYSRGDHDPSGIAQLRPFNDPKKGFVVYGDVAETEALMFRLSPGRVVSWLARKGIAISGQPSMTDRGAAEAILKVMASEDPNSSDAYVAIEELIHSLSHRTIRQVSLYAGIDRNGLSEILFPSMLSWAVYAEPRGDFVLGGLQALYDEDLDVLLARMVDDDPRCALDPGCARSGKAACAVCLHLGEPSCRHFNTKLDRRTMFGPNGYFEVGT